MLRRLFPVATVLCLALAAQAQDVVTFDFEDLPPGPIPAEGLTLVDPSGLAIHIRRNQPDPFLFPGLEVVDLSAYAPGYGVGSLSPFIDPVLPGPLPATTGTFLIIEVISTPEGSGVSKITWDMGDFYPSDLDAYSTYTNTLGGGFLSHDRGIDPVLEGFMPPFGSASSSVERAHAIIEFQLRAGSPDFPNSMFYDNFTFTLTPVLQGTDQFAAGTDAPGSDPGGDPASNSDGGDGSTPPSNSAPVVTTSGNVMISTAEQATTVLAASATDGDGDPLTYRWYEETGGGDVLVAGPANVVAGVADLALGGLAALSLGDHTFRLEVSDGLATTTEVVVVTVENSPPVAAPSVSGTFEIGPTFDVPLTGQVADDDGDILTYEWRWEGLVLASGTAEPLFGGDPIDLPAHSVNTQTLGLGTHTLELVVQDELNEEVIATATVDVVDTTPPKLNPVPSTTIIWPPNHEFELVSIVPNASDDSGGAVTLTVEVASSEPADVNGDGVTIPDYEILEPVDGILRVNLRAERAGQGDGRIYSVTVTATDEEGRTSTARFDVRAPHDKRK